MTIHNKIRVMREIKQWTQEDMAEKLGMSLNGYAKIERAETRLNLEKLQQIANIFNIDVLELMNSGEKNVTFLMNDHNTNYYSSSEKQNVENEKLHMIISHKEELLAQKDNEITALKAVIELLQKQGK